MLTIVVYFLTAIYFPQYSSFSTVWIVYPHIINILILWKSVEKSEKYV